MVSHNKPAARDAVVVLADCGGRAFRVLSKIVAVGWGAPVSRNRSALRCSLT